MKASIKIIACLSVAIGLSACQKSPEEQARDMAETRQEAAQDVRDARAEAGERMAEVRQDADNAQADVNRQSADVRYDMLVAEADAALKIANEQCDALEGDARNNCQERADLDHEQAVLRARTERDNARAHAEQLERRGETPVR